MKQCKTFDHTADIGLAAQADTLGGLFESLAEGLAEVICPRGQVTGAGVRTVSLQAEDVEALAVDFLCEVLRVIQVDRFIVSAVRVKDISDVAISAELVGEPYKGDRHELSTEVKAVTYHQLRIVRDGRTWTGRIILDV